VDCVEEDGLVGGVVVGFVVVAEGGAEDAGFDVVDDPDAGEGDLLASGAFSARSATLALGSKAKR